MAIGRLAALQAAALYSSWSKDPSTKVGACLYDPKTLALLPQGFNGFPRGTDERAEFWMDKKAKGDRVIHAEINCLLNCARHGVRTEGMGMATTFFPCSICAGAMIQAGVSEIVTVAPDWDDPRRGENFRLSVSLLQEANIPVHLYWWTGSSFEEVFVNHPAALASARLAGEVILHRMRYFEALNYWSSPSSLYSYTDMGLDLKEWAEVRPVRFGKVVAPATQVAANEWIVEGSYKKGDVVRFEGQLFRHNGQKIGWAREPGWNTPRSCPCWNAVTP